MGRDRPHRPRAVRLTPPSTACLVYLFADRLLKPLGRLKRVEATIIGVPVPGTDVLVDLGPLERFLLATALWELQRTDRVTLTGRKPIRVQVGAVSDAADGLAGRLQEVLPPDGATLTELVVDHWMTTESLPLNAVVVEAQIEAMDLGVIEPPETPHITPGLLGHHTFPPVEIHADGLRKLEGAFEKVARRWDVASADDPVVAHLLPECGGALYRARPRAGLYDADLLP